MLSLLSSRDSTRELPETATSAGVTGHQDITSWRGRVHAYNSYQGVRKRPLSKVKARRSNNGLTFLLRDFFCGQWTLRHSNVWSKAVLDTIYHLRTEEFSITLIDLALRVPYLQKWEKHQEKQSFRIIMPVMNYFHFYLILIIFILHNSNFQYLTYVMEIESNSARNY